MDSSRLPGKVMLHVGDDRVVGHAMENCEAAGLPDDVVLAIGDGRGSTALTEWAERAGQPFVLGSETNVLARHHSVAERTGADELVRICGDSPFVSTEEVDRLLSVHREESPDLTTNVDHAPAGTVVEVVDVGVLGTLLDLGETHPSARLRDDPDRWNVVRSGDPTWAELADVHMAVDTPEDYWRLTDAHDATGADPLSIARWLRDERQV